MTNSQIIKKLKDRIEYLNLQIRHGVSDDTYNVYRGEMAGIDYAITLMNYKSSNIESKFFPDE